MKGNLTIEITYETEPPFGDFIYSMKIKRGNTIHQFPFGFFGRNIYLYQQYLIVEAYSDKAYRGPLQTTVIDTGSCRYSKLDRWYTEATIHDNMVTYTYCQDGDHGQVRSFNLLEMAWTGF